MNKQKRDNYLIVFFSTVIMVLAIYIGSTLTKRVKLDLTEEGLYTLSDGSKSLIKKIDTPIKLKLYYSKTAANKGTEGIRAFNTYYEYVKDLLGEYVSNSRNNISLTVIDPRPDTKDEEEAISYGLKKFHLTETERYFFGLVATNESGAEKTIEFFDPNKQERIEYEITKLIYSVMNPQKKVVGIISPLKVINDEVTPFMAQVMRQQGKNPQSSWMIVEMLKEFYEVKQIKDDVTEITGVDIVVVIHPKRMNQNGQYALDQFVLKGGKALVLVDPHAIADQMSDPEGMTMSKGDYSSNFTMLFARWGISLEHGKFVGDKYLAGYGRTNPNFPPQRLLALVNCDDRCTSKYKDTISADLKNLTFLFPGSIKITKSKNATATPIIGTTEKGNTYTARPFELGSPQIIWRNFKEGSGEPPIMGVKVVGKFETAFPNGIRVNQKTENGKTTYDEIKGLKESSQESAVIVFSDVDFIYDQFAFVQNPIFGRSLANNNALLFMNSLELLAGSTDLMSVRSKGKYNRSFDVIEKIEFEAEKKTASKVEAIQNKIKSFQNELNQLGRQVNEGNVALIQNEGLRKKKQLNKEIARLKGELRDVKRIGREKIEIIGKRLQFINTMAVPFILLVLGLVFYYKRRKKMIRV